MMIIHGNLNECIILVMSFQTQMLLVMGLLVTGYLYLAGFGSRPHNKVIIKRVYKPVSKDTENTENKEDGSQAPPTLTLTYYPPNPKYLITKFEHSEPECPHDSCSLNQERTKIDVIPQKKIQCVPISKCVTVNIKTRHRYEEVKAFIDSIHEYYPALKVVVMDEFNPEYENTEWAYFVANSPLVTYAQVHPGVGYGRVMAARISDTPYVLVADDDYKFFDQTNVTKLVDILENSNADIVSGTTDDTFPFAGAMRVSSEKGKSLLSLYPGIFYDVIPNYKNCYQADIVKTFFLARKDAILEAGSWDAGRPFYEHEDFFFQMRKERLKIAYCDDVIVKHVPRTRDLATLRHTFFDDLKVKLMEKWKIYDYFSCTVPLTYTEKDTCVDDKRKHFH